MGQTRIEHTVDLASLPSGAKRQSVLAEPVVVEGRNTVRIRLTPEAAAGRPNLDYIDAPTFVRLPINFENGAISVDIKSQLLPDAPDYARAFAGLVYRATDERFECVYLRPTNGRKLRPPAPRDQRAIQYFAYPDWKFDRLRQEEPNGGYEAGADIAPAEWITLEVIVDGMALKAAVNGDIVLDIARTKAAPAMGQIGLWVDIGTEACFSALRVTIR